MTDNADETLETVPPEVIAELFGISLIDAHHLDTLVLKTRAPGRVAVIGAVLHHAFNGGSLKWAEIKEDEFIIH